MPRQKILLAAVLLASPPLAFAMGDSCDIDSQMRSAAKRIIQAEQEYIDENLKKPSQEVAEQIDGKNGACLPALDEIGAGIISKFPGLGGGGGFAGLLDSLKKAACKAGDDFLREQAGKVDYSVGDPYGIVKVGVSGNTDGTGVTSNNEQYDIGAAVKDAAVDAAKDRAQGAIKSGVPDINMPASRGPRSGGTSSGVSEGVRDALKGL